MINECNLLFCNLYFLLKYISGPVCSNSDLIKGAEYPYFCLSTEVNTFDTFGNEDNQFAVITSLPPGGRVKTRLRNHR